MNLLHCKNCGTTYSLKASSHQTCDCEATSGILVKENGKEKVEYTGDPFFLSVDDQAFSTAVQEIIRDKTEKSVELKFLPATHEDFVQQ